MSVPVFQIIEVQAVGGDAWQVSGRAWEDIHVGDYVGIETLEGHGPGESAFSVTGISTYGHQVEELNRMLTGTLILQGGEGATLRSGRMLVKKVY